MPTLIFIKTADAQFWTTPQQRWALIPDNSFELFWHYPAAAPDYVY
jgi:hypothetical protein